MRENRGGGGGEKIGGGGGGKLAPRENWENKWNGKMGRENCHRTQMGC